jgi:2-iminobutanoate/2-iminopropanoate deaminase
MEKLIIETNAAPRALGPYSQGVIIGQWFFVSGQLGLDPVTGKMAEGGAAPEADQALKNIQAILKAGGSGMDQVVRVTLYLRDMTHFSEVNDIFSRHFMDRSPARAAVGVADLPRGALVEIEAQAFTE